MAAALPVARFVATAAVPRRNVRIRSAHPCIGAGPFANLSAALGLSRSQASGFERARSFRPSG